MDAAELLAKGTIERFVNNAHMDFNDEQHDGQYDFDLIIAGVHGAAVEATMSTDEKLLNTIARIKDSHKGGDFVPSDKCSNGWIVHPTPYADIRRIRANVNKYLANIEAEGLKYFFSQIDAVDHPAVFRIFSDLKIEAGEVMEWKSGCQICIAIPGGGGKVTPSLVQDVAIDEARKKDNRDKLYKTGMQQRHLFVYLDPANFLPWVSLVDCSPPPEAVNFSKEITDLWVATCTRDENHFVAWRVENGSHWQNLGSFTLIDKINYKCNTR